MYEETGSRIPESIYKSTEVDFSKRPSSKSYDGITQEAVIVATGACKLLGLESEKIYGLWYLLDNL
jgi:hypothetical protein